MSYTLTATTHFSSAHRLPCHKGKCSNLHGHTWRLSGVWQFKKVDKEQGFAVDFKELRELLDSCNFDHDCLNNTLEVPSAENIAEHVYNHLYKSKYGHALVKVVVEEDPGQIAEYMP